MIGQLGLGRVQHPSPGEIQRVNEQLTTALNTRIVIEQAKGVLSERAGVEMEGAFSLLRQYARSHRQLLAGVARAVVDGDLQADSFAPGPA